MKTLPIEGITYYSESKTFQVNNATLKDPTIIRFLKTKYNDNFKRAKSRFFDPMIEDICTYGEFEEAAYIEGLMAYWDAFDKYTYQEAFSIKNSNYRAALFGVISIREMMDNLPSERIKTEGEHLINRVYNETLDKMEEIDYHVMYELWHVDITKLQDPDAVEDPIVPVIRCHCTSTNDEHWLWVPEHFKNGSPLEAVASLCMYYPSMEGHIKSIIRQGDVFLFEMDKKIVPLPNEDPIHMSKKSYFELLTAQS